MFFNNCYFTCSNYFLWHLIPYTLCVEKSHLKFLLNLSLWSVPSSSWFPYPRKKDCGFNISIPLMMLYTSKINLCSPRNKVIISPSSSGCILLNLHCTLSNLIASFVRKGDQDWTQYSKFQHLSSILWLMSTKVPKASFTTLSTHDPTMGWRIATFTWSALFQQMQSTLRAQSNKIK